MSEVTDYWNHLNSLSELLQGLIDKSMAASLGPHDGFLYRQLCKSFEAHATLLEEQTREVIEKRRRDSSGNTTKDTESEGDRPSDSES